MPAIRVHGVRIDFAEIQKWNNMHIHVNFVRVGLRAFRYILL